jgi:hypothetical protein
MTRYELAIGAPIKTSEPFGLDLFANPCAQVAIREDREQKLFVIGNTAAGKTEYLIRYARLRSMEGLRCFFISRDRLDRLLREGSRDTSYGTHNIVPCSYEDLLKSNPTNSLRDESTLLIFDDIDTVNYPILNEAIRVIHNFANVAVSVSSRRMDLIRGTFENFKVVRLPSRQYAQERNRIYRIDR